MSTMYRYTLPVEQTEWKFDGRAETCFTWECDDQRAALLELYDKGKQQQWDAGERIAGRSIWTPKIRWCSTTTSSQSLAPISAPG